MTCTSSSHVRLLLAFLIAAVGVLAAQPTDSSAVTWTGVGTGTVRARTSNSTIEWA